MSHSPQIVAILNITEDSFSDGGRYLSPEAAIEHARELIRAGSDLVELGPASSHPDALPVPAEEQIARLRPVIEALRDTGVPISIDATSPDVIRFALGAEVAMLNDVRGFSDASLHPELAEGSASLVVMHSLSSGERASRRAATPHEVLESIDRFFDERLEALTRAGVSEGRLIVDPGMGFFLGADERASIAVLKRIGDLRRRFGKPVFISVSRKSFLQKISGRPVESVGAATLAAEIYAATAGADYLRTHEPGPLREALRITRALED